MFTTLDDRDRYEEARSIAPRKIVYHAGPTNSGKTYHALHKFFKAEKAIYCCPLRLLAHEIYRKSLTEVFAFKLFFYMLFV